jgi:hypothetical protein
VQFERFEAGRHVSCSGANVGCRRGGVGCAGALGPAVGFEAGVGSIHFKWFGCICSASLPVVDENIFLFVRLAERSLQIARLVPNTCHERSAKRTNKKMFSSTTGRLAEQMHPNHLKCMLPTPASKPTAGPKAPAHPTPPRLQPTFAPLQLTWRPASNLSNCTTLR